MGYESRESLTVSSELDVTDPAWFAAKRVTPSRSTSLSSR
jgi:hypothetical protein